MAGCVGVTGPPASTVPNGASWESHETPGECPHFNTSELIPSKNVASNKRISNGTKRAVTEAGTPGQACVGQVLSAAPPAPQANVPPTKQGDHSRY